MGQQRRPQEEQNSPFSAALKKQHAFVASSFFSFKYHHNPHRRPLDLDAQKRKNMAFYDTCRKGCFFVCASRASDVCCVVKSQCHTLKHDFLFLSDILSFVVSVTEAVCWLTVGPTTATNIRLNRKSQLEHVHHPHSGQLTRAYSTSSLELAQASGSVSRKHLLHATNSYDPGRFYHHAYSLMRHVRTQHSLATAICVFTLAQPCSLPSCLFIVSCVRACEDPPRLM